MITITFSKYINILLQLPITTEFKEIEVTITGAFDAPLFVLGKTIFNKLLLTSV